ncbi:hypothetical protein MKX03_026733 [Papaver bracteatum]|nr:hypothetical protein MKX03_026733 [Papaver bracteatum]
MEALAAQLREILGKVNMLAKGTTEAVTGMETVVGGLVSMYHWMFPALAPQLPGRHQAPPPQLPRLAPSTPTPTEEIRTEQQTEICQHKCATLSKFFSAEESQRGVDCFQRRLLRE